MTSVIPDYRQLRVKGQGCAGLAGHLLPKVWVGKDLRARLSGITRETIAGDMPCFAADCSGFAWQG
jgi:hypothetical protein